LSDWILLVVVITIIAAPMTFAPLKLFDGFILPQIGVAAIGMSIAFVLCLYNGVYSVTTTSFMVLFGLVYWMTTNSWSTINHSSLKDVPLIFATSFAYIISVTLFSSSVNIVGVCLAVFSLAMFESVYGIGQRFLFDPLFPERLVTMGFYDGKPESEVHPAFRNKKFQDSRVIATIGNTNFACGFFISTLPFVFYLCIEVSSYFALGLIPLIIAMVLTKSRNGILSIVAGLLFFVIVASCQGLMFDWMCWAYQDMNGLKLFVVELVLSLSFLQGYLYLKSTKIFEKLASSNELTDFLEIENFDNEHPISTLRFRFRYWRAGWELFIARPLSGFGLRTYRREVYGAQGRLHQKDGKFLDEHYQTPQPRECHNDFLEYFVEGGIVGGGLIVVIIFTVFYHGMVAMSLANSSKDVLLMIMLLSSLAVFVVNAFFAFPMRLAASAMNFWIALALVESVSIKTITISASASPYLIVLVSLGLAAMLWESVCKPNLAHYHFAKYNFAKDVKDKEKRIRKTINLQPRDSIPRVHALLGYMDIFKEEAAMHADVIKNHFDGMTPGWTTAFNCGLLAAKRGHYDDAVRLFSEALFYFPRFLPAKLEIDKIWHLVPYPQRSMIMKEISENAIGAVRFYQEQINTHKAESQKSELVIGQVILAEKARLNIPQDFVYDMEKFQFLAPREVEQGRQVVEMGPTKILVLLPAQQAINQEQVVNQE